MSTSLRCIPIVAIALLAVPGYGQIRATPQAAPARVAAAPTTTRAVDMFLKIKGIEGESTDRSHEQWIEVESWSWEGSRPSARQTEPAGEGPGRLTIVRPVDKASPKLSEACTSGRSLGQVVVHLRTRDGFDEYTIDEAEVGNCREGSSGDRATETLTLNFGKVESGHPDRPVVIGR